MEEKQVILTRQEIIDARLDRKEIRLGALIGPMLKKAESAGVSSPYLAIKDCFTGDIVITSDHKRG